MTTMRQQIACLLSLLAGIWLGVRAGGSSEQAEASHQRDEQGKTSTASASGTASNGAQRSSAATSSAISNTSAKKTAKLVKETSLADLRRLLAIDLFDCDLERMVHDLETVAKGLPAADLPAAAAMLWSSQRRIWVIMTLTNVLSRWAVSDPKAPLDWLRNLKSDENIAQLMRQNLLSDIGRKHPDLLWEEIGLNQEWMSGSWNAPGMIAQGFAGDLKLAQKFLDAVTDPSVRYFAISGIAGELAKKDPAAAIAWARSQTQSETRDLVIANLYARLADKNPDSGLALLNDISAPLTPQQRERLLGGLAEQHPERAREFIAAGGLKSATMREAALLASNLTKAPGDLIDLATNLAAGEVRDTFLSGVASNLSHQGDLDRAWQAVQDIHPSLERINAMRNYGKGRAKNSIADATAWLTSLAPGADRDAAIEGFTWHADGTQPQMAIEWATAITDPVYRESAIESTFDTWHKNNAKAAEAWLTNSTALSSDEKRRFSEKLTKK